MLQPQEPRRSGGWLMPVLAFVGVFALVAVGGFFAWNAYNVHVAAEKTQAIHDRNDLTYRVKSSMQETFDTEPKYSDIDVTVDSVTLVQESGNKYNGIATLSTASGRSHKVSIEVTDDGTNMMWQAEPGALLPLMWDSPPEPTTTTTTRTTTTTTPTTTSATTSSKATATAPTTTSTTPNSFPAAITGTCDQQGRCSGVQQRAEPKNSAPQLVTEVLKEGAEVTVICQTMGDLKTETDHAPSGLWYRLSNGAYVNSIYITPPGGAVPKCGV